MSFNRPLAIFIMGVSGVGKSTIGKLLANSLSIPFFDGDDYHPEENISKMKNGLPLTDEDRSPWLISLNKLAKDQIQNEESCIIACSALTENYRVLLKSNIEINAKWIFLDGNFDIIQTRIKQRKHFMPSSLLKSQFATLEPPTDALKFNISSTPEKIVEQIKTELLEKNEFGVVGLGVMGKSLARNLAFKKISLSIFNRHIDGVEENIAKKATKEFKELSDSSAFDNLTAFVASLQTPRKILIMVNAGEAVDAVIDDLEPLLSENDIIIDGGNSHFKDTNRRILSLNEKQIHFIGAGISGGEQGALTGPSIMPSGNLKAYKYIKPFLEKIAAKDKSKNACCTYVGPEGSGHFIKTIHNGIEYAEMQLLAETYFILKNTEKNPDEIADILTNWQSSVNSYLLEITIDILRKKERSDWLINKILDKSGNKGTGNWATVISTELGMPSTMISTALFARYLSAFKKERVELSKKYTTFSFEVNSENILSSYQFARVINHIQGFNLIKQASITYNWNLNLSEIARIWTNGCIIRSELMEDMVSILKDTSNLYINNSLGSLLKKNLNQTKKMVAKCVENEIAIPCYSEAINFFNGYKTSYSSANMIQAQRDYFGAHRYERVDNSSGKTYHTNWKNK